MANDQVDLEMRGGEVHCLLGENGAGKSTLISVLAGMQHPDGGVIEIAGKPVGRLTPSAAIEHGIGVVYQHSALVPTMSVIENLMLSGTGSLRLDRVGAEQILARLDELIGMHIDPKTRVEELSMGQRQQLEIARIISRRPNVLILDEPTSMLGEQGAEDLKQTIDHLTSAGVAVLFVTHKLDEALAVGDRVTVLRAGKVVLQLDHLEPDMPDMPDTGGRGRYAEQILHAMFGASQTPNTVQRAADAARTPEGPPEPEAMVVQSLSADSDTGIERLRDISFALRAGEILGIAGIDGQGQRLLAEAIAGQRERVSGRVFLGGHDVSRKSVRERQKHGLRYVTDDRLGEGIVGSMSVKLNLVLKRIGQRPLWRYGRQNRQAVAEVAERLIREYNIRTPTLETLAATLSGGNIQKILLARDLSADAKVVVLNKPSYGLDAHTVRQVREKILEFSQQGGAVLLISTDLDELTALATDIAVIANGRVVGRVHNSGEGVHEQVGQLIAGMAAA